jgi:hypothetical protein
MRLGIKVGARAAVLGLLLAGCGDSGGASESDSASNSDSQASATSGSTGDGTMSGTMGVTEATLSGGMSASGTGSTTDQSGSMSDSQTQGGGSDGTQGMTSGTSTGEDSLGGSGGTTGTTTAPLETTGEPIDCTAAQTKDECVMLGCQPVEGQGFESDGATWCLHDNASYLGCIQPAGCAEVISYYCKGQNVYQLPDACAPDDYTACQPPPDPGMDGWPAC